MLEMVPLFDWSFILIQYLKEPNGTFPSHIIIIYFTGSVVQQVKQQIPTANLREKYMHGMVWYR